MTDLHDARDLEDLYGPLYRYSDHKRGDRISYRDYTGLHQGTILRCVGPGLVSEGGPALGMHYVVEATHTNWPETVFPGELVIDETPSTSRDIRKGDEIQFFGMHHVRLWGKALHDLQSGQEQLQVESLRTPGLIVPVKVEEIITVQRPGPGGDTRSWEREY